MGRNDKKRDGHELNKLIIIDYGQITQITN